MDWGIFCFYFSQCGVLYNSRVDLWDAVTSLHIPIYTKYKKLAPFIRPDPKETLKTNVFQTCHIFQTSTS